MSTTIGTAQTTKAATIGTETNATDFITKFVSTPALPDKVIQANTWSYNFAMKCTDTTNYVTPNSVPVTCYVWRPSTGAKVGNICDANGSGFVQIITANSEQSEDGTFSGSSVTAQSGDVIIFEAWVGTLGSGSETITYYYDGTTVTSGDRNVVSNHASYIETPQELYSADMTQVSALTFANHRITKV